MFNIAILGFGVIGNGVYEVIEENKERISAVFGSSVGYTRDTSIRIKHILDKREFLGHPLERRITNDFNKILSDSSVSVVVETLGGTSPAFEFSKAALEAGKSVVTSNKEVVDKYGDILLETADKHGVSYLYEASVGGGIPIIGPLESCFYSNKITRIAGILNGTTNYILSRMKEAGISLEDALSEAKGMGYTEANPHSDLAGLDSARKLGILAGIAFNRYIPHEKITFVEGIMNVKQEDFELAAKLGYNIKLLAVAELIDRRAKLLVAPHLVKKGSLLSAVNGVFNAVSITGSTLGEVVFYGQGAGSMPTASAVVNDVITIFKFKPKAICRQNLEDGFLLSESEFGDVPLTLSNGSSYRVL
ncbi:MAG: homoserine dehydrogenase [Eubacteriales bacterium]|nr:homoserine dehydrogenase [Eubacteriales bacterium]MDD4422030.1 homoserine dehydrogenase [Eubacteriales bacterium]HBR32496.1 homoserine dehydrogenase [Clostridiales bacterium]